MAAAEIHVTFFQTPAPPTDDRLFETDVLDVLKQQGALLLRNRESSTITSEKIQQHFSVLLNVTNFTQHIDLSVGEKEIDAKGLLKELQTFFPQFVWIDVRTEPVKYGRRNYYFSFIPLEVKTEGFPLGMNLQESLCQQFPESKNVIETATQLIRQRILEKHLILEEHPKTIDAQNDDSHSHYTMIENQIKKQEQAMEPNEQVPLQPNEPTGQMDSRLLQVQEEVKREKYAKERFKAANEKLEVLLDKLELSMIHYGLSNFSQRTVEEDERWDKRIKIDLREYTYLLQKAKYLEQMWRINENLVNKSEKMTVTETSLIYEREQVNQIKASISPEDIYFVIYECQVIEGRVKIHEKPWFRKPYVKLMKLDYDNLVSKAAYFDLLQGESYVLKKTLRQRQPKTASTVEEDG